MGTARGSTGPKSKSKKKFYKKSVLCLKRRTRDIDLIQDDIVALAEGTKTMEQYHDPEAPGGGQFFCVPCSRHFISSEVLKLHEATKPHRKRLKIVAEEKYTQKDADLYAGKASA